MTYVAHQPHESDRWAFRVPDDYMCGFLDDVTFDRVLAWTHPDNLATCRVEDRAAVEQFLLYHDLDGGLVEGREVTLGVAFGPDYGDLHHHLQSDAFLIITHGGSIGLVENDQGVVEINVMAAPKLFRIPKAKAHGFALPEDGVLEFVSISAPRIQSADGYDFHPSRPHSFTTAQMEAALGDLREQLDHRERRIGSRTSFPGGMNGTDV